MKKPSFTPAYVALYPMLCDVARDRGYALAIHGSVARDMDLIAVPWIGLPCEPSKLAEAIREYVCMAEGLVDGSGTPLIRPEVKPHGRLAWAIPTGNGSVIDLSIMSLSK